MTRSDTSEEECVGLTGAFDWRAAKTWAVFLGSAIAMGSVTSAIVLVAAFLTHDLTSLALLAGGAIVLFLFLIFIFLLTKFMNPKTRDPLRGGQGAGSRYVVTRPRSWSDLVLDMLWCCLAVAPIMAALWGSSNHPAAKAIITGSDSFTIIFLTAVIMVLGVGVLFVPDILHCWGRAKTSANP